MNTKTNDNTCAVSAWLLKWGRLVMWAILILAGLAMLAGCDTLPIKGKVCYTTPTGDVCVGSDGQSLLIDGNVKQK